MKTLADIPNFLYPSPEEKSLAIQLVIANQVTTRERLPGSEVMKPFSELDPQTQLWWTTMARHLRKLQGKK